MVLHKNVFSQTGKFDSLYKQLAFTWPLNFKFFEMSQADPELQPNSDINYRIDHWVRVDQIHIEILKMKAMQPHSKQRLAS